MNSKFNALWIGASATFIGLFLGFGFYQLLYSDHPRWFDLTMIANLTFVVGTWSMAFRARVSSDAVPAPDPCVGLFTPLQIEAFQLAKEIRDYLATGLSEDQLVDGYLRRFPDRVKNVMFDLGEAGLTSNRVALSRYIDSVQTVREMHEAALELDKQAVMLNNLEAR